VRMLTQTRRPVTTSRPDGTGQLGRVRDVSGQRHAASGLLHFGAAERKGMREPYTSATTPPERRHGIGAERCPLRLRGPPMQSTTLANISSNLPRPALRSAV
jgi:hypothetical protein